MKYKLFNNKIKPTGWLRRQLELEATGLAGNLDKIWPDIKDSAWIGGGAEGWERVPYWLDGFIPLAYLLEDEDMIARADKYINAIIFRQQADGWICPCSQEERPKYDAWSCFLIGKVLALYCDFTGSKNAEKALYTSLKCLYELMKKGTIELFEWGKFRWFECFIPLKWLYDRQKEEWIISFAKLLRQQGADYPSYAETWKRPLNKWTFHTHIVNLCMMIKYEALTAELLGEKYTNLPEKLWQMLDETNGTAVGTFTGDECLSGRANNQGTELCAVVELMYTCEVLFAATGDAVWADRLEKLAFNALPATISDDMWTHQYDQQVNQIACEKFPGRSLFRTNDSEAHLFGLEPHFGCCTANHGQGWPKLAMNVFLKTDKGLLCSLMLPSRLETEIKGVKVSLETVTEYPFRNTCKYVVTAATPVDFELKIRIPAWAQAVKIDGKQAESTEFYCIDKVWEGCEEITLELVRTPHIVDRPLGLKAVEYGPLVFALPLTADYKMHEYERKGVVRKFPYCDYELSTKDEWRYGLADCDFTVVEKEGDSVPFSSVNPRIALKTRLARVEWDYADGFDTVSDWTPVSSVALAPAEDKELVPYGGAKLRITEMPVIE